MTLASRGGGGCWESDVPACGDGCELSSTLCKYDLEKGGLCVMLGGYRWSWWSV